MPRTLLLAPHSDDETLFASFIVLRFNPDVVVCANDPDEAIRKLRVLETQRALGALGHNWEQKLRFWPYEEGKLDKDTVKGNLSTHVAGPIDPMFEPRAGYEFVFAPAVETNGHEEHNLVGEAALETFGPKQTLSYLTYTRTGGRSRDGREMPFLSEWVGAKLRALSEYKTQHALPGRQEWFTSMLDLREWVS